MRAFRMKRLVNLAFILASCNEPQPMTRMPSGAQRLKYFGPIPKDFVNTESAGLVQERLRDVRQELSAWIKVFSTQSASQVADGFPDIGACPIFSDLYGGVVSRGLVQDPTFAAKVSNFQGQTCGDVLLSVGSSLPLLVRGLGEQMIRGEGSLALRDNDCVRFHAAKRLSKHAAFGLYMTKPSQDGFYLDPDLRTFRADLEAGAAENQVIARGDMQVELRNLSGSLYQGAGLATVIDTEVHKLAVSRVEIVETSQNNENRGFWITSVATVQYGGFFQLHEKTKWVFSANDLVQRELVVDLDAAANATGYVVDIQTLESGKAQSFQMFLEPTEEECRVSNQPIVALDSVL